jgi:hypothetical protein
MRADVQRANRLACTRCNACRSRTPQCLVLGAGPPAATGGPAPSTRAGKTVRMLRQACSTQTTTGARQGLRLAATCSSRHLQTWWQLALRVALCQRHCSSVRHHARATGSHAAAAACVECVDTCPLALHTTHPWNGTGRGCSHMQALTLCGPQHRCGGAWRTGYSPQPSGHANTTHAHTHIPMTRGRNRREASFIASTLKHPTQVTATTAGVHAMHVY